MEENRTSDDHFETAGENDSLPSRLGGERPTDPPTTPKPKSTLSAGPQGGETCTDPPPPPKPNVTLSAGVRGGEPTTDPIPRPKPRRTLSAGFGEDE